MNSYSVTLSHYAAGEVSTTATGTLYVSGDFTTIGYKPCALDALVAAFRRLTTAVVDLEHELEATRSPLALPLVVDPREEQP